MRKPPMHGRRPIRPARRAELDRLTTSGTSRGRKQERNVDRQLRDKSDRCVLEKEPAIVESSVWLLRMGNQSIALSIHRLFSFYETVMMIHYWTIVLCYRLATQQICVANRHSRFVLFFI